MIVKGWIIPLWEIREAAAAEKRWRRSADNSWLPLSGAMPGVPARHLFSLVLLFQELPMKQGFTFKDVLLNIYFGSFFIYFKPNVSCLFQHVEQVLPFLSSALLDSLWLLAIRSSFFRLINTNLFSRSSLSLLPKMDVVFQLRSYQSWTNYALTKLKFRTYGRCFSPTNHLPTSTKKAIDLNVNRKYESRFLVQKEA